MPASSRQCRVTGSMKADAMWSAQSLAISSMSSSAALMIAQPIRAGGLFDGPSPGRPQLTVEIKARSPYRDFALLDRKLVGVVVMVTKRLFIDLIPADRPPLALGKQVKSNRTQACSSIQTCAH